VRRSGVGRPFVLINVAATADGKTDTVERRGAAVSSDADRARVDRLRAEADAVMVGGRTLLGDDPRLLVRSPELRAARVARGLPENPAKVAVVSRPALRPDARFLTAGPARRIVLTTRLATDQQLALLRDSGAEAFVVGDARVDLAAGLVTLRELGLERLLVEGGGALNFELLRLGLVDELRVYVAPLVFGGETAPTLAAGDGLARQAAIALRRTGVESFDDGGVLLTYAVGS
jgi:2,5-diamino-6-(ribosylamino)-4(3H)-pyrimidinone 5'-phosphate reductase